MEDGRRGSIFRFLAVFLFSGIVYASALQAKVTASVDNPAVYRGDPVTLTLSAEGDDIDFPPLTEIAGFPIQSRGTSRSLSIINGKTTRTIEQRLVFTPTKSTAIPALDITVDGKVEHTLPLRVKVLEPQAAPEGAPVRMEMKLSQSKAYVGEPVTLDLVLKYKPGTQIDDIQISEPKLEHFWIKRLNQQAERSADTEGYITQTYRYLLFAQQSGELTIPPIFAQIGTRQQAQRRSMFSDPFFNDPFFGRARMQYRKVYSEPLTLQVDALPEGLEVYGDFTMDSSVDKTTVEANKPVNLTIHIEGSGNVEDIPKFEPKIDSAIVYANDPVIKGTLKNGRYFGTFDQTIAVIPERDVTITPQTFRYFDSRTKTVKTLKTKPFFIKVEGGTPLPKASAPVIETASAAAPSDKTQQPAASLNLYSALGLFAAGVAAGALLMLLARRRESGPKPAANASPMSKRIRAAKSSRALFELLLPYKGEAAVIDEALLSLEAELYRGGAGGVDRKALAAYFDGARDEEVTFI